MAQIIKHRRGSISSLASVTANVGELVMATGSIGDLTAPVIFIGDSAVAGGYKPVSKIFQGTTAPDLTSNNWGTTMNGTPFYSTGNKSLNILNNAGNTRMDLTGNIEGNTIVGVTITSLSSTNITGSNGNFVNLTGGTFTSTNSNITSLTGSNANITNLTGNTFTSTNGNITSLTGSNANVSNITGTTITGSNVKVTSDLNVGGKVIVTGDISGSNLNLTGNATVDGDIILKGNINIGNQTTDIIQFGGEVSSSIVPLINNSFDLGSPTQGWKDLFVSGTANIGTLNLGSITLNSLALPGDLTVSGTTILSGSVYHKDLTNTRVLFAGVNGQIIDNSGFTFDTGSGYLVAPIVHSTDDGNGTNFLIGNDMWLGDVNEGNATRFMGNEDNNYAKIYLGASSTNNYLNAAYGDVTLSSNNTLNLQAQFNNVNVSAYDNSTLYLNADGGEGAIIIGNGTNNLNSYNNIVELSGSNYAELHSGHGYVWAEAALGAFIQSDSNGLSGFSARHNGIAEVTGSLGINGTTTVTGSLIVSDGSATINQGLIAQNSNLLLTSGSSLIIQNTGYVKTDFIEGNTSQYNYLSLNGNGINGQAGVELSSAQNQNISLWAEGGTVNVTGSVKISNGLEVNGSVTFNTSPSITGLTQNRIVLAGSGGQLSDNNNLVFDTAKLQVAMGLFEADTESGSIRTSGSLFVSSSATVVGNLTVGSGSMTSLGGNLYVSGNLEVLGSSTNVNLESHTVNIGDNIVLVNAYSPFQQYAGIAAYDSGSSGLSGSLLWDSLNDYWMFVSASGQSSKLVGTTAGTYGSEVNLTSGTFPIATANNTIGNSLLVYSGTTLTFNTNKFTVDSGTGDTLVSGNFKLTYSGGTDNGTKTSEIMFRNSDNLIGFVSTTETTDVLDGILGYKNSNGGLVFSTVIDGGTY